MFLKKLLLTLLLTLGLTGQAAAQTDFLQVYFGKNLVNWDDKDWKIYKSEHFDFHHKFDLDEPKQKHNFERTVGFLEEFHFYLSGKVFKHNLGHRVDVILVGTHREMESSNILQDPFMPEGPQGVVDSYRNRVSAKEDYYPYFRATINLHELVHVFQQDLRPQPRVQVPLRPGNSLPRGFYEGGSDFIVSLYRPYDRDDIFLRRRGLRLVPPELIPTWEELRFGQVSEFMTYVAWRAVHSFLEDEFGQGVNFQVEGLKSAGDKLGELIYKLAEGKLGNPDVNPEVFNRAFKEYWIKTYKLEEAKRPKPFEETENFKGRAVIPYGHRAPSFAPCVLPNGEELFLLTYAENGQTVAKLSVPPETGTPEELAEKQRFDNWTPFLPPSPWEYLFYDTLHNGSALACSADGKRVAVFARKGRDHKLFVLDAAEPKKILAEIEIPFDQASSPAFGPDGKRVYFSAAHDVTRDVYVLNLEAGGFTNLTNDLAFDTGPAVSPDGTKLVYVSSGDDSENDFQHLWLLDLASGSVQQLTFGRSNNIMPSWTRDGKRIYYVSDEVDWIWNLYSLDFETGTTAQWTNLPGGVANPVASPGDPNKVFASILWDSDKTPPIGEDVFELTLKKPVREFQVRHQAVESGEFVFTEAALSERKLDPRQLENPIKHPKKWQVSRAGAFAVAGIGSYYGGFMGGGFVDVSDVLENHHHVGGFLTAGDFKLAEYGYLDLEKRTKWGLSGSFQQMPIRYPLWDPFEGYPEEAQPLLNITWLRQSRVGVFFQRPRNKFERWEAAVELRKKSFDHDYYYGYYLGIDPSNLNPSDDELLRYFSDSSGTSAVFKSCYVKDTVLWSYAVLGPWHGNAFSACAELAPGVGSFLGYTGFRAHARRYQSLGNQVVAAFRGDLVENDKNGEVVLMGGDYTLRGFPRLALAGNRAIYGSAELRFPLLAGIVFPGGVGAIAPVRGALFADWGKTGFAGSAFPDRTGKSVGGLVQFPPLPFLGTPLNVAIAWTNEDGFKQRQVDAILAFSW